ncbi:MAG TPA: CDP-alcohol phosphatidyltransferase family protein [Actinomycetota bacterium]|nr:CDP-alcohol phosphatidyltransferase family protein [Actinomycetota bacterium]
MVNDRTHRPERQAPRVRDLPPPRKNESAAGGAVQRLLAWPYRAILAFLIWTGVRPWQLTLLSPLVIVLAGWQIVAGNWLVAGFLLIIGGVLDVFDGSVARHRGEEGRSGAFMDSVLDRVSDMILFSSLFWSLASQGETVQAALALLTLVVSLGVSQIRAEAEAAGLSLTEGLFQRLERMLALMVGLLIPGMMFPALILLSALGVLTVLQRGFTALSRA